MPRWQLNAFDAHCQRLSLELDFDLESAELREESSLWIEVEWSGMVWSAAPFGLVYCPVCPGAHCTTPPFSTWRFWKVGAPLGHK